MLYFNIDEITELGETLETWPGLSRHRYLNGSILSEIEYHWGLFQLGG